MKKLIYLFLIVSVGLIGYYSSPLIYLYLNKGKKEIKSNSKKLNLNLNENLLFKDLGNFLIENKILLNSKTINSLIKYKGYSNEYLNKGKYTINRNWSTNKLVNQLYIMRNQNIIDLYVPSARNLKTVIRKIASQIAIDTSAIYKKFNDENLARNYGFSSLNFSTIIIPNTYEVYGNLNAKGLFNLFRKEYKKFWNSNRIKKANIIGLSQSEVTILASIVQMEQQIKFDEHSKIAGLYINRLQKGMKLQADPTVKFALKKPNLRRLYYKHLEVDSPYNTYKYDGLPPGPICIVDPRVIDAVLNYSKHDYIYMCAQPSYSGYHNFSSTIVEHERYKKMYISWLSLEKIN